MVCYTKKGFIKTTNYNKTSISLSFFNFRNEYSGVSVQGEAKVEQNGNSIKIGDLNFRLKIDKIK